MSALLGRGWGQSCADLFFCSEIWTYSIYGVTFTIIHPPHTPPHPQALSSSGALDAHLLQICEEEAQVAAFLQTLLDLLQNPACHDRLALPLLKTIEHFMTNSSMLDQVGGCSSGRVAAYWGRQLLIRAGGCSSEHVAVH